MEETIQPIGSVLRGDRIKVTGRDSVHKLGQDGYGDDEVDGYHLKPFEALYLMSTGKLVVRKDRRPVSFDGLLESCQETDPDILSKYLIYRDLRSRGYVAKDGFGFGMDFRVYDRGHFGEKGAKFLVFGLNEGRKESARSFYEKVDEMARMGKEPVIAVIERRGEIIYYKINRVNFFDNRPRDGRPSGV